MKIRTIISIVISLITMLAVPLALTTLFLGNDALGVLLILMLTVNPAVSIVIGILSGWDKKVQWYLPLINSVIYTVFSVILMGFDAILLVAGVVYFLLGIAAGFITKAIKK